MSSEAMGKKEAPLPQLRKIGWPPDIPWAFPRVLLGTRWLTGRSTWLGPSSAPPPPLLQPVSPSAAAPADPETPSGLLLCSTGHLSLS